VHRSQRVVFTGLSFASVAGDDVLVNRRVLVVLVLRGYVVAARLGGVSPRPAVV